MRNTVPILARSLAWDDLRLINAIHETGTLPAAAARLRLDHSTVFRRLRQIEAGLGTAVFERHRTGYVPTAAGAEIAALAARVDEDIAAVLRRIAGQSLSPAGEVRVATNDALLSGLLVPLLVAFRQACPLVRIDIVTGNTAHNLSRRDADIAIRATSAPPETLVGRKIGRIAWAAYATPAQAGELGDVPFEAGDWAGFGDALGHVAPAALLRARVPEARIACRFDTVAGLVAAVAGGLGRGLLPCFAGDGRPELVRLAAPFPELTTDLWLLTHEDLRHVPRVRALMDFLSERLSAMRPMLEGG